MYMQRLNTQYTNWFLPQFFGGCKLRPAWIGIEAHELKGQRLESQRDVKRKML